MTPPTTDAYQRAIDLLDQDLFWDRYLTQLENDEGRDLDGQARRRDRDEEQQQPNAELTVVTWQPDGEHNDATVRPTADPRGRPNTQPGRGWRSTTFQRVAIAAAAGIVIAGLAFLNTEPERAPIDVFTETSPTATAETPAVVVIATPAPEATVIPPTPTAPDPTATPEPLTTPDPVPPLLPPQQSGPELEPALPTDTESEDESSSSPEAVETEEAGSADDTTIDSAAAYPVDADSSLGQVLAEINDLRRSQGLRELRYSPALAAAAHDQAWSLTDYQDTDLTRQPDFNLDPLSAEQTDPLRQSAWADANVVGGINIEQRLPAGWNNWKHYAGQEPVLDVVRADVARELHVGDFTHIGIGSAAGKFATATVVVYASYLAGDPPEPPIAVRTDRQCRGGQVATQGLSNRIVITADHRIATESWPDTMSRVEMRLCAGMVRDSFQFDLDSRYRVSVVRRSDGNVMGTFTCFTWNTCDATVDLEGSSAPFDIVLRKLSPEGFEISLGQVQMAFHSTDGQVYKLVAGSGSRVIDSDVVQRFWDRLGQTGGGWILESNA